MKPASALLNKELNYTAMKKKEIVSLFASFFILTFLLSSCTNTQENSGKSSSIGSTAEILVVTQNDAQWNGPVGQAIRKTLSADMFGMPQKERMFKLLHIASANFSDIFQKQRNILMVRIDPKIKAPKITVMHDKWAAPQLIFTITAPDTEAFVKVFNDKKDYFIEKYMAFERKRIQKVFSSSLDQKVIQAIHKNFSFTLNVPVGFYVAKNYPHFMWIRHEANRYSQGIVIISVPYKDTAQFARNKILDMIQRFQLHQIPGPTNGSFMSIDRKFVIPKARRITDFPGGFAVEIRGLWRVEHDFMGGPFVSYTFVNKKTNELVTLFGYVYYPNHKKRDLLLQVESILYSVKFDL
jgi:hypothetical protein